MYLAGYLRKYGDGHSIEIYDARLRETPPENIRDIISEKHPEVVGITAFTMEAEPAHLYARLVKEVSPNTVTVIGGPYPSSAPETAIADKNIDFAVQGEGEITLKALLEALKSGGDFNAIGGLSYRRNGEVINSGVGRKHDNLDDIPYPAWDLIDLEAYFSPSAKKRRLTNPIQMKARGVSVFSSRGCPFGCTYCHSIFGRKLRKRSAENVIGELKWLKTGFGVEEIEFIDDVFNLDLERAKRIMDLMIQEKLDLKFSFPNGLRADRMDEELIAKMKSAGCYRINYAIESGSDRIQRNIKKRLNLKRAREVIDFTADKNISIGGFFMLGFPDETEAEMKQTIDFALKSKCHTASFFILTPFPGTEMYDEALRAGFDMQALYTDYNTVSKNLSQVSGWKIEKLRKSAFRKFYFNPRRIYSIFKTTPNKMALFRNVLRTARLSLWGKEY
jgi:radical SAM superfamily enzyme YgiQ (UPF0313 family)